MTTPKKGLIAIAVVVAVAAVAAIFLKSRGTAVASHNEFSVSQWKASGYQDPKSAVLSISAAIRDHDGQAIEASMTPDLRKEFEFFGQQTMRQQGKTFAELLAGYAPAKISKDVGIHIVKEKLLGDDWALVIVSVHSAEKKRELSLVMKKTNNEWKLDYYE